jgi:hypothetical protein
VNSNGLVEYTSKPIPLSTVVKPMAWPKSERDEILQRVSNFRVHQEKMAREREHYYSQAKAKMLAAIDNPVQSKYPSARSLG